MDKPRSRRPGLGLLVGVLLAALTGCGLVDGGDQTPATPGSPQVADALTATLKARARAVRTGDRQAFLATVDHDDPKLVRRQRTYFANLAQLPISRLRYRLDPATLIRAGDRWSALVEVRLQLSGFDQWPVVSREEVGFAPGPDGSSYVLAKERGDDSSGRQPWDSRAIVVRERPGVLGIFDHQSADQADAVLASVAAGVDLVGARVPYDWDRHVVVYALSGTSALSAIAGLPGGDPERLDGVSVPVGQRGDEAASTRLVLHPRMLSAPPAQRDRLIRHELTHIALADRDNHAPTWLSEGIAEYVSVQPIAEADRTLARPALIAASSRSLKLPDARTFNGPDSEANYGVAWWACEALVDLYGEPMLWQLLDKMGAADGDDWDAVLEDTLQMSADDLAAEAGRRMLAAYGVPD
ncbi:hypothetical protein [Nocardioides sp. InS609-2]|uniref:hypothetical protein n=1 Tax=Nocardioides sp. InS609-2 TaxID=2760705 RepID=UPI0020BF99B4|nr:hypothetical protein [Nocardioides sp. InS609-2]